jgi:hypothetical protein
VLPALNGIEAARRIRKISPASKILFVSENRSVDIAEEALGTGARGYVVKSDANKALSPAIKAVLEGERFISASLAAHGLVTSDRGALESSHRIESNPYLQFGRNGSFSEFLASVVDVTAADYANVQLFDSKNRVLRIVVQHGFESEFLDYFDTVSIKDNCACGRAMNSRSRIIVTDVASDPLYSNDSRGVMLRAKVRSLQCTPLIDSFGNFVGMVSTHYIYAERPMSHMWKRVDDLATHFLAAIKTQDSNYPAAF